MVEAAFITPVFFLIVFGLLEYGLVVRDNLTVAAMTRDTARAVSAFGNEQYGDFKALRITGQTARSSFLAFGDQVRGRVQEAVHHHVRGGGRR